jgi:hypothetical protein
MIIVLTDKSEIKLTCPITLWRYGMKEKEGGFHKLYRKILSEGHEPREALDFISEGLGDKVEELISSCAVRPVNAEYKVCAVPPHFSYIEEKDGYTVDYADFADQIARSMDGGKAVMRKTTVKADITVAKLKELTSLRGSYTTSLPLLSKSGNRI